MSDDKIEMPTDAEIEAKAREIYLTRYAGIGGRWELVETKDAWRKMAREFFLTQHD